jgi:hypothetical protein
MATLSNKMRIYEDQGTGIQLPRENVEGWHESGIRRGVYKPGSVELDDHFLGWRSRCTGRVVIQPEIPSTEFVIPKIRVYIELLEDLVSYLLTFDARPVAEPIVDVGLFYCPYVPLTMTGVVLSTGQKDLDNGEKQA